jgi:hypothetical protein
MHDSRSHNGLKVRREVVKLDSELTQRARNAVMFLRSHGEPSPR